MNYFQVRITGEFGTSWYLWAVKYLYKKFWWWNNKCGHLKNSGVRNIFEGSSLYYKNNHLMLWIDCSFVKCSRESYYVESYIVFTAATVCQSIVAGRRKCPRSTVHMSCSVLATSCHVMLRLLPLRPVEKVLFEKRTFQPQQRTL
jgi:hypothetical protein